MTISGDATRVDLSNAYLGDDKCGEVLSAVRAASASGPVHLDLRGNRLEVGGAKMLAALLQTRHRVVALSLEWNSIGLLDDGVVALAHALEVDATLTALDLRNNSIGPTGAQALAAALQRNRSLQRLDLRWNEIGNAGALALVEMLQGNDALMSLEVTGNNSSLKHAEEIERLLARNRALHEPRERKMEQRAEQSDAAEQTVDEAAMSKPNDELLVQVLADKDALEVALKASERQVAKAVEQVEASEMQQLLLRKELDAAKEERDRYQQREVDAKREVHDLTMRLEEMETRRKMEFDEYRASRAALERDCSVLRDKLAQQDATMRKLQDQSTAALAELESRKYALESEVHRLSLSLSAQQGECERWRKELEVAQKQAEREAEKRTQGHMAELATLQRQHEQAVSALQLQLTLALGQADESKRAAASLRDANETLQADLLQAKVSHEKQLHDLTVQLEGEMQTRMDRSHASIAAQVVEMKRHRESLQRDADRHSVTIAQLQEENVRLQRTSDEKSSAMQQELDCATSQLQQTQAEMAVVTRELEQAKDRAQQLSRRAEERERAVTQMKQVQDEQLQRVRESAATAATEFHAAMNEKADAITRLEQKVGVLELALADQAHQYARSLDALAASLVRHIQTEVEVARASPARDIHGNSSSTAAADAPGSA